MFSLSTREVTIPREDLLRLTDPHNERNIYIHSNPLARTIFWQRLSQLLQEIREFAPRNAHALDFGGGSGVFSKSLCTVFKKVTIVDRDPEDAKRIQNHFRLDRLEILEADLLTHRPQAPYDVIIAADVLEHFADLAPAIESIKSMIRNQGWLFISVPTENWIYEIGRKLVRKTKPEYHYHPGT